MALSASECNARVDHLVKLMNGMASEQVDEIDDKAQQDYEMEKARICDETFSKVVGLHWRLRTVVFALSSSR